MKYSRFVYEDPTLQRAHGRFALAKPWAVKFRRKDKDGRVRSAKVSIGKSFLTDGLSIPRTARLLFDRQGPLLEGAIVHDYLYARGTWKRRDADRWLRDFTREARGQGVRSWLIYWALRAFGGKAWRMHRKHKAYNDTTLTKGFSGG